MLPYVASLRRGFRLDAAAEAHQPAEPHWYLSVLAVDPASQRSGVGSALMEPALTRCDQQRMPAYLESSREANVPFYRRFGFELTKRIRIQGEPSLWLMWREPA